MDYQFEICRRLSREHQEAADLLDRLEKFIQSHGAGRQPDWEGPDTRRIMGDLKGALRTGIPNHFAIEEQELFPLYAQDDGADMVELLLDDHRVILGLADEIRPLVEKALSPTEGLDQAEWDSFRAKGNVFVTELASHAEKEDFGFVPALDELMDPGTAKRVLDRYLQM